LRTAISPKNDLPDKHRLQALNFFKNSRGRNRETDGSDRSRDVLAVTQNLFRESWSLDVPGGAQRFERGPQTPEPGAQGYPRNRQF